MENVLCPRRDSVNVTTSGSDADIRKLMSRGSIFRRLLESPQNRCELNKRVEDSRTTVYRALNELQSCGLVTQSGRKFHPTPYGETLFCALNEFRQSTEKLRQSKSLLQSFSESTPIAHQLVANGVIVESSCLNPRAPLNRLCDFIDNSTSIKAAVKVLYPEDLEAYNRNLDDELSRCTLIMPNQVAAQVRSEYGNRFSESGQISGSDVFTTEKDVVFSLLIAEKPERRVCIAVYDDRANLQEIVLNDSPDVHEWTINKFDEIKHHNLTQPINKLASGTGVAGTTHNQA